VRFAPIGHLYQARAFQQTLAAHRDLTAFPELRPFPDGN
jgi:hypothetical protein